MAVALTYGQLSELLAKLHYISPEKRTAFRGRLQHLQRLGFPPGANTGKGRAASYGAGSILLLALALELTQVGVSPERSIRLLENNLSFVTSAAKIASNWRAARNKTAMLLYLEPTSLAGLTRPDLETSSDTFFYDSWPILRKRIENYGTRGFRRLALINLSDLIANICEILEHLMEITTEQAFLDALQAWTDEGLSSDDEIHETLDLRNVDQLVEELKEEQSRGSDP